MTAALIEELARLPLDEKLQVLELLWDSVASEAVPLHPLQVEEVQARRDELRRNPALGLSLDELKARLRATVQGRGVIH
jgi:putative addiction module component (TIGR02574 family)